MSSFIVGLNGRARGRSDRLTDRWRGDGIRDRPLGEQNLRRGFGFKIKEGRSLTGTGVDGNGEDRRDEEQGT